MDGHIQPAFGDLSPSSSSALVAAQEACRRFMSLLPRPSSMLTSQTSYIHLEEVIYSTASRFLDSASRTTFGGLADMVSGKPPSRVSLEQVATISKCHGMTNSWKMLGELFKRKTPVHKVPSMQS
jgi:hypothetical protein